MRFTLQTGSFAPEEIADNGNRFLIGNGFLGVRGTLEEYTKKELAAVNLAGIYDQVGNGWREPLNAPNPFFTRLSLCGAPLSLPEKEPLAHEQALDFRCGVMRRHTRWNHNGITICVESERFASLADVHLLAMRYTVTADADVTLMLAAGIDGDVWDIHGPHYCDMILEAKGNALLCTARVQNGRDTVSVARKSFLSGGREADAGQLCAGMELNLKAGEAVTLTSICAVFTSRDGGDPGKRALGTLEGLSAADCGRLLRGSKAAWEAVWRVSEIRIEGDGEAERAVNYSVYQLNCIAPRHDCALSIPARGLSGQTYKGAVFWDSELFLLDYFLYTQPEIARSLVCYRIRTLPGAIEKAASYGYGGAFYAWESQEGGFDACSDYNVTDVFTGRQVRTYFKDKQIHSSAAVVWALMRYVEVTGDCSVLAEGGARMALACAKFYVSRMVLPRNTGRYELHDVIGPDEYHERVNNNAYTNRMARFTLESAQRALQMLQAYDAENYFELSRELGLGTLLKELKEAAERLYVPRPGKDGVVEQFDGYFSLEDAGLETVRGRLKDPREYWGGANGVASDTQVIKQADVVTMLELFHDEYGLETLRKNWAYYEPRTEHGSTLSVCMYALLACRFGRPDLAYPFFLKSAQADIKGGGKQWAGLVYIGGTHPAAAGGAWKTLVQGFAGLSIQDGVPMLSPCLPAHWKAVTFRFTYKNALYEAHAAQDGWRVERIDDRKEKCL
ncbi:MAG TPA: glycosyl hydrolase family 65 protein [Feifaniaceae bacterium]|nr:glycosyl hydrolase family 65 protein [Feifaniaceae bacterium]